MMHQYKPVSSSDSLADQMTGPIIAVSETVREANRGENSVEQGSWVEKRERQVKNMRETVTEWGEKQAGRVTAV